MDVVDWQTEEDTRKMKKITTTIHNLVLTPNLDDNQRYLDKHNQRVGRG